MLPQDVKSVLTIKTSKTQKQKTVKRQKLQSTQSNSTARNQTKTLLEWAQPATRMGRALPAVNNSEQFGEQNPWIQEEKWQQQVHSSPKANANYERSQQFEITSSRNPTAVRPQTQGFPHHNQYSNPLNYANTTDNFQIPSLESSNSKAHPPGQRIVNLPFPLFRGGPASVTTKNMNIVLHNKEVPAFSIVGTQAGHYGERQTSLPN